jgi:hypothetical protein
VIDFAGNRLGNFGMIIFQLYLPDQTVQVLLPKNTANDTRFSGGGCFTQQLEGERISMGCLQGGT